MKPPLSGPIEPFLTRELHLLELLFGDPNLTSLRERSPAHPAVKRYDTITAFITHKAQLNYPDETNLVLEVGSLLLDGLALAPAISAESIIDAIDDQEVIKQLRTRVSDPQQFTDQMAAMTCWDLLRTNGLTARLVEKEGLPDIIVSLIGSTNEWVEVKRIRIGSNPSRARNVIGKANAQIKRAGPQSVGAVYLSIERPQQRVAFDDIPPPEVQAYIDEVKRELGSGCSRSVSLVIVTWDDYMLLGTPPERTNYYLRRRSLLLEHPAPHFKSCLLKNSSAQLERTIALPITWSSTMSRPKRLAPIRVGRITVTELFRTECELTGDVRSVHAIEALQRPSAVADYAHGEGRILLVTKTISLGYKDYILLLFASVKNVDQTEIFLGFRIYGGEDLNLQNNPHPLDVFSVLLNRYGAPLEAGKHAGLFIPAAIVELPPGGVQKLVRVQAPNEEPIILNAFVKVRDGTPQMADVAWAFAIFTRRYRADVRKQSLRRRNNGTF